ncbi:MAG: isoprenylcysteine carboxylmethyltransferase family protein, partial [Microbacterium sp.]
MSLAARLDARAGRAYFAVQAAAGAAWWAGVALDSGIRRLTIGDLPAGVVAAADVPLFVIAAALAAVGIRFAAEVAAGWTVLVTVVMVAYATI